MGNITSVNTKKGGNIHEKIHASSFSFNIYWGCSE